MKKFPAFYGTRRFITAFTRARHLSLSWASSVQFMPPHPTSPSSFLIVSSHLRLGLPSGLFPSGCPTKTLYTPFCSSIFTFPTTLKCLIYTINYFSESSIYCILITVRRSSHGIVADLSSKEPEFNLRSFNVGSVMDKVAVGQIFSPRKSVFLVSAHSYCFHLTRTLYNLANWPSS